MKCSELLRKVKKAGWYEISQEGSHIKMRHLTKDGILIFPNHGSKEISKGLEKAIKKQAGI
jgi:mRNA interferase HicA